MALGSRGQPSHPGGDGSRGGRGGRGRGRGRGRGWNMGTDRDDIEREVQALTRTLGLPGMLENTPIGGRGRGQTPQFNGVSFGYPSRGQANKTPRGLGLPTPPARGGISENTPNRREYPTPIDLRDRPLLRPIKFVRSSTVLFQDENEIFRPEIVDAELDDTPTAGKVEQAFARANTSPSDSENVSSNLPLGRNGDHPPRPLQPRFVDTTLSFDFDVSSNLPVLSWGFTEADLLESSAIGTVSIPSTIRISSSSSQADGRAEERVHGDRISEPAVLAADTFQNQVESSARAQPAVSLPSRPVSNFKPLESVESVGAALQALSFAVDTMGESVGSAGAALQALSSVVNTMGTLPVEAGRHVGTTPLAPVVSLTRSIAPSAKTLPYVIDVTGGLPTKSSGRSGAGGTTLKRIPDIPPVHVERVASGPLRLPFFIDTAGNLPVKQQREDVAATAIDGPLPQNTDPQAFEEPSFVRDTMGDLPGQLPHADESTTLMSDMPIPNTKQKKKKKKTKPDPQPSFVIDTEGHHGFMRPTKVKYPKIRSGLILGDVPLTHAPEPRDIAAPIDDEGGDEDVVVFVPPTSSNPTSLPSKSLVSQPVTFSPDHIASIRPTISFADVQLSAISLPPTAGQAPHLDLLDRKEKKRQKRILRKRKSLKAKRLAGGIPRVGDSDVEWGSSGPPGHHKTDAPKDHEGISAEPSGNPDDHDMGIDMDLDSGLGNASYARLVKGLLAPETVTIDDLEDRARIQREDEEDVERGSSGDEDSAVELRVHGDAVIDAEERRMVGEDTDVGDAADSEGDNESSSDSSDIDLSFRTRLTKVRSSVARALSRLTDSDSMDDTSDDGDDDNFGTQPTWADRDDAVIAVMQDVVDSDAELLSGRSKKKRKQVFKAIQNGDLDAVEDIHNRNNDVAQGKGKKKKKEGAYVPPELKDQWRKDQEKKAKYKKDRAKERMLASMDLLPSRKSGKKKNKLGKRISEEPQPAEGETTPIVDLRSLVSQIRVFLADLGSSKTMVLPPMDKPSRARVHSIASCFKLKSQSKGWGSARYTTLIRTTKSGVSVDERKISWLLEGKGFGLGTPFSRPQGPVRHRDGDVVGSKAAKIGESNVGFRLLRQMGWSEGEHIGVTGGLADPLRIVIKNSKRGLGSSGRT